MISSLSYSIVFLYFFALITKEGFLISPCYSLELCIQTLISFLFSFAFISITLGDRLKMIHFLLISISMEYPFPSPHFQSVCVPRFEVGLL